MLSNDRFVYCAYIVYCAYFVPRYPLGKERVKEYHKF